MLLWRTGAPDGADCAAHTKGRFDADPAVGRERKQRVPKLQKRRRKMRFDRYAALKGRNARFLQRITCGAQVVVHDMQPLLQSQQRIIIRKGVFRESGVGNGYLKIVGSQPLCQRS